MTPEEAATELMRKIYPRQPTGGAVEHEILYFIRAAVDQQRQKDAEIVRSYNVSWGDNPSPTKDEIAAAILKTKET